MSDVLNVINVSDSAPAVEEVESAAAWKAAAGHPVILPSGVTVRIKVLNLVAMAKIGTLPNDLVKLAIPEVAGNEPEPMDEEEAAKALNRLADFQSWVVAASVVSPAITEADVPALPTEDSEMIVAIATRQRDIDAVGKHIGGLDTNDDWRRFRGLAVGDEAVLGE